MKSIRTGLSLAWIAILILGLALTACSPDGESPGGEIVYYEETKIVTEEEAENIIEVTENRTKILFSEPTAFAAGIEPGDILVSEHPVPGIEHGFLVRVTEVSDGGKVVEVEPATLEDAIEEGVISVTETIPLEDLLNGAMWTMGVEVLQVQGGYDFSYSPAEGVTIEGYLLVTADAEVRIEASFWEGLEEFEFVFSPGLEMEATLRVKQGIEWDEKYTIATIPGPPIPIWGPVTITPEVELVVGTTGTVDASLEATVTYDRGYDVGLRYDGTWSTISSMRGEGATLEEPSFSGQAEARVFGGVVLSGTAGVSYVAEAGIGTEILGNIRASGEIENSPWQWQYDLELYLSAQVFADLNLLRIAHVSWESNPWEYPDPPYNLAYGASGRVTTEGGEGLDGVQINFSGGHSSVTSNVDGYWCKHLLRGEVEATPEKTGYVFDPLSITIAGSVSDLDFQALEEGEPIQYELTISSTASGSVTTPGEGTSTYDEGTVVDLVATPASGYRFVNWYGDVDTVADVYAASTTITMNGDYSIMAIFLSVYDLTISSTVGGSVTVPGEGAFTYKTVTVVSLAANPASGYRFVKWTGDVDTIANVNAASTTITMNGDYSITANFEEIPPDQYNLTTSSTTGGTVTTPGEGTFTYDSGTMVDLVATPYDSFVEWTGDVSTIADVNDATTTITMNGNYAITANFETWTVVFSDDFEYDDSLENHGWTIEESNSQGDPQTATDPENAGNRVAYIQSVGGEHVTPSFYHSFSELPLEPGMEISIRFYDTGDSCYNCDVWTYVFSNDGSDYVMAGWYRSSSSFTYAYKISGSYSGEFHEPYGLRGIGWHTFMWRVEQNGGIDLLIDGNLIIDDLMGFTTLSKFRVNSGSDPYTYSFSVDDFSVTSPQIPVTYYTLTVAVNGSGSTNPSVGQHSYAAGTVVSINATPASCYDFVNWTGNVGTIANVNAASTTITMNGDYSIMANFEEEAVTFPDLNLEAVVREAVAIPQGPIYPSDLDGLTSLNASEEDITDLTGLEYATSLTGLCLADNQISDISPLVTLTNLTWLCLDGNQISDIFPLVNLTSLTGLGLSYNQISDISPLANLTSLTGLDLSNNQISDITPLVNLTSLTWLDLSYNQIGDIEPLVNNPGLSEGDTVYLGNNPLSDTSINTHIPQLEARGVHVYY